MLHSDLFTNAFLNITYASLVDGSQRCNCGICRGCIHCLKLSPNLRRVANNAGSHDFGAARLDAIIDVALKSTVPETDEGA